MGSNLKKSSATFFKLLCFLDKNVKVWFCFEHLRCIVSLLIHRQSMYMEGT